MTRNNYPVWPFKRKRNTVKCADCGFLGTEWHSSREVLPRFRRFGNPEVEPLCYLGAHDLLSEYKRPLLSFLELGTASAFLKVVSKERVCNAFTPYVEGLSPPEHKEQERNNLRDKQRNRRSYMQTGVIVLAALIGPSLAVLTRGCWFPPSSPP